MKFDFVKAVRSMLTKSAAGASLTPMSPDIMRMLFNTNISTTGKAINEHTAMAISSAWGCMRILSEVIGSLPWQLNVVDAAGNASKAIDHPLADVLTGQPNQYMTPVELKEAIVLNLCQAGNSYNYIQRSGSTIIGVVPYESKNVQVKIPQSIGPTEYKVLDRGVWTQVPSSDIWHIKGFGSNGRVGLSPLGCAREAMGMALSTEEFGNRFFSQGGKPSGIVSIPNFLTPPQREIARENLQQMLGGMSNAHKFALFEGGMKPEPWGDMPLEDMQFLSMRKFSVQEICRFYRVPPHMVADLEKGASYASIEQMSLDFVMFTLMPYFTRIESSVSKWLLTPEERRKYSLKFNFEGLLRADSKGRSEFYASALQNGWMNRNEVRAKENLNRSDAEGMEDFTVQSSMIDIDNLPDAPAPKSSGFFSAPQAAVEKSSGQTVVVLNQSKTEKAAPQPSPSPLPQVTTFKFEIPPLRLEMGDSVAGSIAQMASGHSVTIADAVKSAIVGVNAPLLDSLKATSDAMETTTMEFSRIAEQSAAQVKASAKENSDAVADCTVMAFERAEASIKELAGVMMMPRKAVFNSDGEPIGTVIVKDLH